MGEIKSPEAVRDASDSRLPKPTGAWAGYLIFGLCLLVFIAFDAQAADDHQWPRLAFMIVFTLAFVTVPTGGVKSLRRTLQRRRTR